jgi:hypothetical protein
MHNDPQNRYQLNEQTKKLCKKEKKERHSTVLSRRVDRSSSRKSSKFSQRSPYTKSCSAERQLEADVTQNNHMKESLVSNNESKI